MHLFQIACLEAEDGCGFLFQESRAEAESGKGKYAKVLKVLLKGVRVKDPQIHLYLAERSSICLHMD